MKRTRKEFKKSYLVIDVVLAITLIFLVLNLLIFKQLSFWFCAITSLVAFGIIALRYGYEGKKRRFTYESMFYIFSYTIIYLIIIYILGIFTGFVTSIYKFGLTTLIKNILPYVLLIVGGELLRYEVARKCETSPLAHVLVTLILVVIDCTIYFTTFDLSIGDGQIKYICYIILPSISKNCLLLYTARIAGPYPGIIYRILLEIKDFIVPISPDFGMYIESVLLTIVPGFIGFGIHTSLKQYKNKEVDGKNLKQSKIYIYASVIAIVVVSTTLVMLTSCKFKYGMLSIGSGSMTGVINKGDAVIYEALNKKLIPKKGDIIVFRKEGRVIVHRIIKVVEVSRTETVYYTKGDANADPDGYPIPIKDIIGIVRKRVRYVGYPSVALHELTKHESTLQ